MALEIFKSLQIKLQSCKISYDKKANRKVLNFSNGWESAYDKTLNGCFIRTGELYNVGVLDLDDMNHATCKLLKALAESCSNLAIKTRRGYHYYFSLDPSLVQTAHKKDHGFDYLANNGIILCAPSKYKDENDKEQTYKILTAPENKQLNKMSNELLDQLKTLITDSSKPREKDFEKVQKKELTQVEKSKIAYDKLSNDQMKSLLENLHIKRSNDYVFWLMTGLALKCDGYDFSLWDEFSQRSKEKYEIGTPYYIWISHLRPNRITIGTLIYWLKTDNYEAYKKLVSQKKVNNYDGNIDLTNESEFSDSKMYELLKADIETLNGDYVENMELSKSFKYFNHFHIHFTHSDIFYKIDIEGKKKEISPITNINNAYAHYECDRIDFISLWKRSSQRQRYEKVNFLPNEKAPTNTYNTFTGFYYDSENKTYDITKIQPFIDHVKFMCNNDEKTYTYLINWFAHIRQFPNKKTETAIVLYSDLQGTGKNTIIDIFNCLFKGYTSSISEEDINQKFNKKFENKLFIAGDEISGSNKHDSEKLKNLITQTIINIEPKGREQYQSNDRTNFLFTSNNDNAFKTGNGDRRFTMVRTEGKPKSKQYYNDLRKLIEDDTVMADFDKYISSLDLTDFNTRNIPMTDYKKDVIKYNLPAYIQMVLNEPNNYKDVTYKAIDLLSRSKDYAKSNRLSFAYTSQKAFKDMAHYFSDFKHRTSNGVFYKFPSNIEETIEEIINQKI